MHHGLVRSPGAGGEAEGSSSSSSSLASPQTALLETTPGSSRTTRSDLLSKPGHVFWHSTPSPSQQLRQREFQKYLLSNNASSPILPLGTQAFREELLLQQEEGGGATGGRGTPVQRCCNNDNVGGAQHDGDGGDHDGHQGINTTRTNSRSRVQYRGIDRRNSMGGSASSTSSYSLPTPSSNASTSSRKFSRRVSRRSMVTTGDASSSSHFFSTSKTNNQQAEGGVQQLLVDLDRHLKAQKVDVEEEEEGRKAEGFHGSILRPNVDDDEDDRHLIQELDKMFSSPDGASQWNGGGQVDSSKTKRKGEGILYPADKRKATLQQSSSPSNSREWSRTKSSPAELEASPRSASGGKQAPTATATMGGMRAIKSSRDPFVVRDKRQRLFFDEENDDDDDDNDEDEVEGEGEVLDEVERRSRCTSALPLQCQNVRESASSKKATLGSTTHTAGLPTRRTSPRKRNVLTEIGVTAAGHIGDSGRANSELQRRSNTDKEKEEVARPKTRSSHSPPKKWATRAPRIGLSRQGSLASAAGHMSHSQSSSSTHSGHHLAANPAAPFKQPNRSVVGRTITRDGAAAAAASASMLHEKQKQIHQQHHQQPAIIIDDSEEEEKKKPIPVAAPVATADEEDTTFDTSMDDMMLCDAVEMVEATQRSATSQHEAVATTARKTTETPTAENHVDAVKSHSGDGRNIGDDSFEMDSSDNEAIVCAMEAGGW